jgi:class 3 adenylate cyclase
MTEKRKLAAILAADVVGFSRLAGADEERTLARLRALRRYLIDPTIAVHNGRVVKRTGDGIIIEFRSVVDAVRCAIEVQNDMVERNAGLPQNRRMEFRVGIHIGDVIWIAVATALFYWLALVGMRRRMVASARYQSRGWRRWCSSLAICRCGTTDTTDQPPLGSRCPPWSLNGSSTQREPVAEAMSRTRI